MARVKITPKLLSAFLVAVAALALAACGSSSITGSTSSAKDQVKSATVARTLPVVKQKEGANAQLLEVQISAAGIDYKIRKGQSATQLHFGSGSTSPSESPVSIVGTASLDGQSYPISEVDPAAIDKILAAAPKVLGVPDFTPVSATLSKTFTPDVEWGVPGDGGGRTGLIVYAKTDGSGVHTVGGKVPTGSSSSGGTGGASSGASSASSIAQCVQNAGTDVNKIKACAGQ